MKLSFFVALALIIFIFFYWAGLFWQWHLTTVWFDKGLHFYGGLITAAIFVYLFAGRLGLTAIKESFLLKLTLGLGFAALIGVLWEFHEFAADWWLGKSLMQEGGVADTMADLFFDLAGAFVFLVFYHSWIWLTKRFFTAGWRGF